MSLHPTHSPTSPDAYDRFSELPDLPSGGVGKIAKLLSGLTYVEFDAIEAFDAAIDRLQDNFTRERIAAFRKDHERHIVDLRNALRVFREEAPKGGDMKQLLTTGRVVLGGLMGDRAVLRAMIRNEHDCHASYKQSIWSPDLPGAIRSMLIRHEADERRHRAWLEGRVNELPASALDAFEGFDGLKRAS